MTFPLSVPHLVRLAGRLFPARWLGLVVFLVLTVSARVAAQPSFTAELDPDSVTPGETATLKLIFTNLGDVGAPTLPALTNCTVEYQGASRQVAIVNFKQSSSLVHHYALHAQRSGNINIPALSIELNGQTYTSRPLVLQVGPAFDPAMIGFLRISVPKSEVYVGETFPLEIRFYGLRPPDRQIPPSLKLDGFVKGRQTVDNLPPETLTNNVYSVTRWSIALTAVKSGDLTVGPAEFQTLYTFQPRQRRRSGIQSLFEQFFGAEQRQINFTSGPVTLKVLNPPIAGRPTNFTGAVGRFRIEYTASPTNVAVGDPVTLRVKVTGQGNFDGVSLPDLPAGVPFQLYPGTNSFNDGDPLGLSGTKTFEAVLVPESPGIQTLRWPWITSWDPRAKAYASDQARPLILNVRPGANAQAQPAGTVPTPASGEAPVKTPGTVGELAVLQDLGPLVALTPSPVTQSWFWGLMALPLALYAATLLGPVLQERRREDPAQVARRRAQQTVSDALEAMRRHAGSAEAGPFFTTLNTALQHQLSLIFGTPPGTFTDDVVDRLKPMGLDTENADRLQALFERLAEARFSPQASGAELTQLHQSAEQVIAALRTLPEAQ